MSSRCARWRRCLLALICAEKISSGASFQTSLQHWCSPCFAFQERNSRLVSLLFDRLTNFSTFEQTSGELAFVFARVATSCEAHSPHHWSLSLRAVWGVSCCVSTSTCCLSPNLHLCERQFVPWRATESQATQISPVNQHSFCQKEERKSCGKLSRSGNFRVSKQKSVLKAPVRESLSTGLSLFCSESEVGSVCCHFKHVGPFTLGRRFIFMARYSSESQWRLFQLAG